jgi:biotin carboxylase
MKKKRLLILGGLSQQNEIIKDAQKNGCHVIVVDYLTDSPGKKIADESYLISITDVDAIVNLCKEKGIDGVMNYCIDPGQKPYQQICEKLGLPCYGTKQQFDILTNKDLFKESCVKYGVGVIQGKTISETFNETDLTDIVYPVIVKPSDGRASKGISKCNNFSELQNAITYALSFSERKTVNIEKFTKKPELCAKYFVCDGEIYLTALSDTHTHFENGNRVYICGKTYPSRYLQEFKETADIKLRDMIKV